MEAYKLYSNALLFYTYASIALITTLILSGCETNLPKPETETTEKIAPGRLKEQLMASLLLELTKKSGWGKDDAQRNAYVKINARRHVAVMGDSTNESDLLRIIKSINEKTFTPAEKSFFKKQFDNSNIQFFYSNSNLLKVRNPVAVTITACSEAHPLCGACTCESDTAMNSVCGEQFGCMIVSGTECAQGDPDCQMLNQNQSNALRRIIGKIWSKICQTLGTNCGAETEKDANSNACSPTRC